MLEQLDLKVVFGIGVALILLGLSFAFKFYLAGIRGKVLIWQGLLPLTVLSPLITHLPPGKRSLLKYKEGMWVHIFVAPIFLVLTILCLAAGSDLVGLPGTEMLNLAVNGGNESAPPAVLFSKAKGYHFPILARAGKKLHKIFLESELYLSEEKKYLKKEQQSAGSYQDAMSKAKGQ